jgi:TRAP-type C4-dicarboxylate transport system substrate-binding protein
VRDHQFLIIWAKLYVAIRPKSWNRISKTDRDIVTALKRKAVEDALLCSERTVEL